MLKIIHCGNCPRISQMILFLFLILVFSPILSAQQTCNQLFSGKKAFEFLSPLEAQKAKTYGFLTEGQASKGLTEGGKGPHIGSSLQDRAYVLKNRGYSYILKVRDYSRTLFATIDYLKFKFKGQLDGRILKNIDEIRELDDFFGQVTRNKKTQILRFDHFNEKEELRFLLQMEKEYVEYFKYIEKNISARRSLGAVRKMLSQAVAMKNAFGEPFHLVFNNVAGLSRLVADPFFETNKEEVPGLLYKYDNYKKRVTDWIEYLFNRETLIVEGFKKYMLIRAQIRALYLASKHAEMVKDSYFGFSPNIVQNWAEIKVPIKFENGKFEYEYSVFRNRAQLNSEIDALRGQLGIRWFKRFRTVGFSGLKNFMNENVEKPYADIHRNVLVFYAQLKEIKARGELSGEREALFIKLRDNIFEPQYYPTVSGIMAMALKIAQTQSKHWGGKITEFPPETIEFFDYLSKYGTHPMRGLDYGIREPWALLKFWGQMDGYFSYMIKRNIIVGMIGIASYGGLHQVSDYVRPFYKDIAYSTDINLLYVSDISNWWERRGVLDSPNLKILYERSISYLRAKYNIPDSEVIFTGEGLAKGRFLSKLTEVPYVGESAQKFYDFYNEVFGENPNQRTQSFDQLIAEKYPEMVAEWHDLVLRWYVKNQPEHLPQVFREDLNANDFENWFSDRTLSMALSAYEIELGFHLGKSVNKIVLLESIERTYGAILREIFSAEERSEFYKWISEVQWNSNHNKGFSAEPPLNHPRIGVLIDAVSIFLKLQHEVGFKPASTGLSGEISSSSLSIEQLKFDLFVEKVIEKSQDW